MAANLAPWALFASFVLGLIAVVLFIARSLITGRLVPRLTHQDTLKERDGWHSAYDKAAEINAEHAANGRKILDTLAELTTAQRELSASQREITAILRTLVPPSIVVPPTIISPDGERSP